MHEWVAEFVLVLSRSTKTQVALMLGFLMPVGLHFLGLSQVGQIELHGPLGPFTDAIREQLMHRYDKLAWLTLGGFLLVAVKSYRRDSRRLFGI